MTVRIITIRTSDNTAFEVRNGATVSEFVVYLGSPMTRPVLRIDRKRRRVRFVPARDGTRDIEAALAKRYGIEARR